ncbi:tyrosine-type recombinase/integrase [Nocardia farcinica]|uniref:tyrosine-type recombinase/integrase n=1 Tax=Nocardia farcinica TaxID=37329 RepID=UPI0018936631|nr:tyrosine-type recombinase/integrase [Nocardia farcinica]MBF6445731.1 site-specific integrase [Nocardia farcinica]
MLTELTPGRWKARVLVRDASGRRREVTRVSPLALDSRGRPVPDRTGSRAAYAVLSAALRIRVDHDNELSESMTVRQLWTAYRAYLVEQGRAENTLARYDVVAELFDKAFGLRRLLEVTTSAVEAFIAEVGKSKGPSSMKTARNVLSGMFKYAVRKGPLLVNPVREAEMAQNVEAKGRTGGARDITVEELRFILSAVRTSQVPCPRKLSRAERNRKTPVKSYTPPTVAEYCDSADLADLITLLAATGLRRSQILGLLWSDIDLNARTLRCTGKVVRVKGTGLVRIAKDDDPKNRRGTIALPDFAVAMLKQRQAALEDRRSESPPDPEIQTLDLVFPSAVWTLRDPQNVGHEWQRVRDALAIPDDVTAHSFRHAVATILDDAGLSARITADVLGHADPAMTQRHYMARGRTHRAAADALDRAIDGE